jgi:hypothetical protein
MTHARRAFRNRSGSEDGSRSLPITPNADHWSDFDCLSTRDHLRSPLVPIEHAIELYGNSVWLVNAPTAHLIRRDHSADPLLHLPFLEMRGFSSATRPSVGLLDDHREPTRY